jgi:hypothetical protein
MKKFLWITGGVLLMIMLLAVAFGMYNMRDRHPGYRVDLNISSPPDTIVQAGFAAVSITPEITDTWVDVTGNYRFEPEQGDTWEDVTGSGSFDGVWMAGFQNRKPAQGVNDDLWARAMVLDDGRTRMAWVVLDAIGFFGDHIIDVRKRLPVELDIDYVIISSTHTHSAPDLLGLWGPGRFTSGVDPDYLELVKSSSVEAIRQATERLRPARFRFAVDEDGAGHMIGDTRKPIVVNGDLRIMQVLDARSDSTLGTLISWDNHPETIWNKNLMITSDYPHYLREGIENGIWHGDSLMIPGLGGTAVFASGNIGGLMTTDPSIEIRDPFLDTVYVDPSFDKVRAQGLKLARLAIEALKSDDVTETERAGITLRARSIELPLDNKLYRTGALLGLFDRGAVGWMRFRSEVAFWQLGPADFLHHPGELYPEIADGGIEAPEGRDFEIPPREIPPLRSVMNGKYKFISGLSNDMIGYIIPKSQWDEKPPHTYGYESPPYGEINSLGPETAPILHEVMLDLIRGD